MAATYSEEEKDLDLVDFLFCCSSKRCDCAERLKFRAACQWICMYGPFIYYMLSHGTYAKSICIQCSNQ